MKYIILSYILIISICNNTFAQTARIESGEYIFELPAIYLAEKEDIPPYWLSNNEEVFTYIENNVRKGSIEKLGESAGGRPIWGVFYGTPRSMEGRTTTISGAISYNGDIDAFRGVDHDKSVYLGLSGVHGGEFEGIVGTINLISVIETGKDLRGKEWPEITAAIKKIDRIVLIPIVNPDGRARIPIRMQKYRGGDRIPHEFLNTGGYPDGTLIGWRKGNKNIPMDFSLPGFPGGYPNDAGVNISHDDFFGEVQPETRILLDIVKKELPDITINMHTGADYMSLHRPFSQSKLQPVWDSVYIQVRSRLALEGLLKTKDIKKESDPTNIKMGDNLYQNPVLNFASGTLIILVESPCHGFSRKSGEELAFHTPEMLLDAHLYCHLEVLKYLAESGGRSKWKLN